MHCCLTVARILLLVGCGTNLMVGRLWYETCVGQLWHESYWPASQSASQSATSQQPASQAAVTASVDGRHGKFGLHVVQNNAGANIYVRRIIRLIELANYVTVEL